MATTSRSLPSEPDSLETLIRFLSELGICFVSIYASRKSGTVRFYRLFGTVCQPSSSAAGVVITLRRLAAFEYSEDATDILREERSVEMVFDRFERIPDRTLSLLLLPMKFA